MKYQARYINTVQHVVDRHKELEKPILGFGTAAEEYEYMNILKYSYIRTIQDIDQLWHERSPKKILEIGSFLGTVSFSLKHLGYEVYALDIPEFAESALSKNAYADVGVPYVGVNLKERRLPYEDQFFDAIIMCETLEHLHFNPLPVLDEINRILKPGGYLYVAMPNQASIINRVNLMRGKSIRNSISHYFKQLDRNENKMVAIHWREYTLSETVEMLTAMGFDVFRTYYFTEKGWPKFPRSLIKKIIYIVPSFRKTQVAISRKVERPVYDFWFTDANS